MRAGRLRCRLNLQSRNATQSTSGEVTANPTTVETVWGRVESLSGRELVEAQQVNARISHRVTVRHNSTITPEHRFLYGTRILDVEAALNTEERDIETVCLCSEVA